VTVTLNHCLGLAAVIFVTGMAGFIVRRNAIVMLMCIELMLNAANLALVAFSRYLGNLDGQLFVFFVMAVAAAEVAVGLAIIVTIFKHKSSVDIDQINLMKW